MFRIGEKGKRQLETVEKQLSEEFHDCSGDKFLHYVGTKIQQSTILDVIRH